jgi:hypothetical protein
MQNALINDSEKKSKGLSLLSAVVFIVGELAGSGVLALPKALAQTGTEHHYCNTKIHY